MDLFVRGDKRKTSGTWPTNSLFVRSRFRRAGTNQNNSEPDVAAIYLVDGPDLAVPVELLRKKRLGELVESISPPHDPIGRNGT